MAGVYARDPTLRDRSFGVTFRKLNQVDLMTKLGFICVIFVESLKSSGQFLKP